MEIRPASVNALSPLKISEQSHFSSSHRLQRQIHDKLRISSISIFEIIGATGDNCPTHHFFFRCKHALSRRFFRLLASLIFDHTVGRRRLPWNSTMAPLGYLYRHIHKVAATSIPASKTPGKDRILTCLSVSLVSISSIIKKIFTAVMMQLPEKSPDNHAFAAPPCPD
ncbi:hypothetical protein BJY01DRAFT_69192 [Aspergillus pseudoustus]|uniref:Uncharacterized protein n=1 Tax=Aspergillus pseudoustus TaxID=1810923 RepID=A0ABR4J6C9_9EURO